MMCGVVPRFRFARIPGAAPEPGRDQRRVPLPHQSGSATNAQNRSIGRFSGGAMELGGLEPPTSWVRSRRSSN